MTRKRVTIEGNEAAAYVAYNCSEVIAIYPITPSSGMGEMSDAWAASGVKNIYGTVPNVTEMQSEGGAAGAVHGALQSGSLTTTFTASQGLLLMIPNMYKIAGELTPTVFHVSARSLAAQALSIFGDHSDVMSTRHTGFAMLASGSNQEVMDLAAIAHKATLETRIPFLHFFDGFRTSHEINKIEKLTPEDIKSFIDADAVTAHRERALSPDHPFIRGTAQNPDVYFQGRETVNKFYNETPAKVQAAMDAFAKMTGRQYKLYDYVGAPDAEKVIIMMGSGAEATEETVNYLNAKGEKLGLLKVRLYRPFSIEHFINALPDTVKSIAVLDRTKEPGATGEPLYQDVLAALIEGGKFATMPKVIGGRYGLSSKEFTPAMIKAVYDEMSKDAPKNHFTVGINDDVTNTSLDFDPNFKTTGDVFQGMFFGLGSDGTVGANKNSIKIIGEGTDNYAQGFFVYDSKKSGSTTTSHLRFGKEPIQSTYLIQDSDFVGCHQFTLLDQFDVLETIKDGGVFLLNSPYENKEETWNKLPKTVQKSVIDKKLKIHAIDAYKVAKETGMGNRINTIMQTCFFYISNVLPQDEAIAAIKGAIEKTYSAKGEEIVKKNFDAVDATIANLYEIEYGTEVTSEIELPETVSDLAPEFVKNTLATIMRGKGDTVPVSQMPVDGTFPAATTQWEKRNVALEVPEWDPEVCIQCSKCALVCPHAAIRVNVYDPEHLDKAPETFKSTDAKGKEFAGQKYTIQVAVEDCTGCSLCVEYCPAKNKQVEGKKAINMVDQIPLREQERENFSFFDNLPQQARENLNIASIKGSQLLEPLFEFSGACAGCGETPYVKLVSQMFGDRMMVANATGCSSIYGGNLPTTPWAVNDDGRGPAWSNSLFEDNAEFGMGMRLSIDKHSQFACELLLKLEGELGSDLVQGLINAEQKDEAGIHAQRAKVELLKEKLGAMDNEDAKMLLPIADYLVKKSVWIMGGDGWAYDIGYGGLDHVIASGKNVNILVMDTEVYSNTGGQMSKATPTGAVAKFAAGGKPTGKKDLAMMAMNYGNVYVAQIAMGANDNQTVKAILEAEAYDGPSIIIAYSHCIAHGIDMAKGLGQQKMAVESGHFPIFRYNPDLLEEGKNPLKLDSKAPKITLEEYAMSETRYKMLAKSQPEAAKKFMEIAQEAINQKWMMYEHMANMKVTKDEE